MNSRTELYRDLSRIICDLLDTAYYEPTSQDLKYIGVLLDLMKDIESEKLLDEAVRS